MPRGSAVREALLRRWPGRLLLVGAAIKLAGLVVRRLGASGAGLLDTIDTIGSLALVFGAGYYLYRLALVAKRHLLWRVRRKLILSYVFIGFVPALLIVAFFLVSGLMLILNVGSYLVRSALVDVTEEAQFVADAAVREIERRPGLQHAAAALNDAQAGLLARYPEASMALVPLAAGAAPGWPAESVEPPLGAAQGVTPLSAGRWTHINPPLTLPAWVNRAGFGGLLAASLGLPASGERTPGLLLDEDILLIVRAIALPAGSSPRYAVIVDIPVTEDVKARLREATSVKLGPVRVVPRGEKPVLPMQGRWQGPVRAAAAPRAEEPAPDTARKSRRAWVALFDYTDWSNGRVGETTMAIEVNVADIYDRVSAGQVSGGASLYLIFLVILAILFLIIEFAALVMGLMLAKSITGSVHQLFLGTAHARRGDFGHKIAVVARDQLGELAESFNEMTDSIEDLMRQAEEKRRLEEELRIARAIQMSLLPQGPLSMPGLSITAVCEPAREVGGDYYDLLPLDGRRVGLLIADVSGKGTSAAFYMAELKGLMLSLSRIHASPRQLLIDANRIISDHLDSRSFITMIYAVIDLDRRTMTYARAGHTPLIVRSDGGSGQPAVRVLAPDGMVLGVRIDRGELFERLLEEQTIELGEGDLLLFFTDGISEAMNAESDCFGESRLARLVEEHGDLPPEELRERILREIRSFVGDTPQHDDMTMILLKVDRAEAGSLADASAAA